MMHPTQNGFSKESGTSEAEETLRLIARLPAPEGLEERVHAGLRAAPDIALRRGRVLAWPGRVPAAGGWLRAAAAAAIVFVVAGGGWEIYTRVQPAGSARGIAVPRIAGPGQFTEGGAVRRPQTLVGPVVTPPAPPSTAKPKSPAKPAATPTPNTKSAVINRTTAPPVARAVQ